jgi:hypothetical protein
VTVLDGILQVTYSGKFCSGITQAQGQTLLSHGSTSESDFQLKTTSSTNGSAEEFDCDGIVRQSEHAVTGKQLDTTVQASSGEYTAASVGPATVNEPASDLNSFADSGKLPSSATPQNDLQVRPQKNSDVNDNSSSKFRRFFAIVECEHPLQGSLTLDDAALFCRTDQSRDRPVASLMGLQMQSEVGVFKYILYIRLGAKTEIRHELEKEFTVTTAAGTVVTVWSRHKAAAVISAKFSLRLLEKVIRNSADVQHVISAVTFSEGNFMMVPSVSAVHT